MKVFLNENILASGSVWEPQNQQDFESNIQVLLNSLSCFQFFSESELYYNSVGINSLIDQLKFIDECNDYSLFNVIDQLRQRLYDLEASDWSQNKIQKTDYYYIVQLNAGFNPQSVNGSSLAEAVEYNYNGSKTVVLNFNSSEFNTYGIIKITRVNINPPQDTTLHNIDSICSKDDAIKYYLDNRDPIAYNHNPKHGENHTKVIKKNGEIISPLECTQIEARRFIILTVGGEKNTDLFAYDSLRDRYIRFKYDSMDNARNIKQYHGFYPHDQKISQNVKDFLFENRVVFNNHP